MAQIPSIRTFPIADFPRHRWMSQLLTPLNQFIRSVITALNSGLTVTDNLAGQVNTVTFLQDSADTAFPLSFLWSSPQTRPAVCIIGRIDTIEGDEAVSTAVTPKWRFEGGRIVIESLRGTLTNDRRYTITFLTLAE